MRLLAVIISFDPPTSYSDYARPAPDLQSARDPHIISPSTSHDESARDRRCRPDVRLGDGAGGEGDGRGLDEASIDHGRPDLARWGAGCLRGLDALSRTQRARGGDLRGGVFRRA